MMGNNYLLFSILLITTAIGGYGRSLRHRKNEFSKYNIKFVDVSENENFLKTSREKRSTRSIMDRFLEAYNNPGLKGDVLYIARRDMRITFDFDVERLQQLNIVKGEFYVYKRTPRRLPAQRGNTENDSLPPARVAIHQTIVPHKIVGQTMLIDMQDIAATQRGWCVFDVTKAVRDWISDPLSNRGLEVWVESAKQGKMGARVARKTKFVKNRKNSEGNAPTLIIYYSNHPLETTD